MRHWTGMAALAAAAAVALSTTAAVAEPALLISIDGLIPDDVIKAEERGYSVPNLRAFMTEGSYATGVVNVLPTVTYPNHTTLITGAAPARHGVSNNVVFDPYGKNNLGWYWYEVDIKTPTLWDAVKNSGGVTASIGWPVSVGADSIDWNIPEFWRAWNSEDLKLVEALSTDGLVAELEELTGVPFAQMSIQDAAGDDARAKYAAALIAAKRPQLTTVHLISLDHYEHEAGPGSQKAQEVLEALDVSIGELVAAARAVDPGMVIAVASDHGFAAITQSTNLLIPFIEAGLIAYDPAKRAITSYDAIPWGAGGSAAIVLARPDDKALKKKVEALLKTLAGNPELGIARILSAKDIARMGGAPEASFWVDFAPGKAMMGYRMEGPVVTPASGGTHGFLPSDPEMRASFFISGAGVPAGRNLGEIDMRAIAPTIAKSLGVDLGGAEKPPLF